MLKMMRMEERGAREVVGPMREAMRTRRKVAVGWVAVVWTTVDMIVSRNERGVVVVVVVVVVRLWASVRARFERVGWEIEAGEKVGLRRIFGIVLAVTKRVMEWRNWRLRSEVIACQRHGWTRGWERSTATV